MRRNFIPLTGAHLLRSRAFRCLSGCEGKPTSAAVQDKHVGPPPTVTAVAVGADTNLSDPLAEHGAWSTAKWYLLSAPIEHDADHASAVRGSNDI